MIGFKCWANLVEIEGTDQQVDVDRAGRVVTTLSYRGGCPGIQIDPSFHR